MDNQPQTGSQLRSVKGLLEYLRNVDWDRPTMDQITGLRSRLESDEALWATAEALAGAVAIRVIDLAELEEPLKSDLLKVWDHLRNALGYQDGSALERLFINQVVLSWIQHFLVEYLYRKERGQNLPINAMKNWEQRVAIADRRLTNACKGLAEIRKLMAKAARLKIEAGKSVQTEQELNDPIKAGHLYTKMSARHPQWIMNKEHFSSLTGLSLEDLDRLEAARLLRPSRKGPLYKPKLVGWGGRLAYLLREGWSIAEIKAWARGRWSAPDPRQWPPHREDWVPMPDIDDSGEQVEVSGTGNDPCDLIL